MRSLELSGFDSHLRTIKINSFRAAMRSLINVNLIFYYFYGKFKNYDVPRNGRKQWH
jgi:hypothetical protein